jgi:sulfonate transport system substrate-binding protein
METRMKLVRILVGVVAFLGLANVFMPGASSAPDKVVTIGYQKYGNLILLKGRGGIESRLAPLGFRVAWKEFPSGPPLLEALNAGAVDFGQAGETPPVFAQAAGVPFVYVAHEPPAPQGEAILVPQASAIRTLADLGGKKVALNKGANVHFLLVRALERAGLKYSEITPIYLAPADARAAFERGAADAWVIWDPFLAAAQAATGASTLIDATGLAPNRQYYFAAQGFADANPAAVDAIVAAIADVDRWVGGNETAVANELSANIGIPAPVLETALKRLTYGVHPMDDEAVADQQRIADTFFALGLVPKQVVVSSIVRKPPS